MRQMIILIIIKKKSLALLLAVNFHCVKKVAAIFSSVKFCGAKAVVAFGHQM